MDRGIGFHRGGIEWILSTCPVKGCKKATTKSWCVYASRAHGSAWDRDYVLFFLQPSSVQSLSWLDRIEGTKGQFSESCVLRLESRGLSQDTKVCKYQRSSTKRRDWYWMIRKSKLNLRWLSIDFVMRERTISCGIAAPQRYPWWLEQMKLDHGQILKKILYISYSYKFIIMSLT